MEEFLQKLAKVMNTSVEGLYSGYPLLRDQFVRTYTLDRVIRLLSGLGLIVGGVALVLTIFGIAMFLEDIEEDRTKFLKSALVAWFVVLALVVVSILLGRIVTQLAPDLMLIKSLM